MVVIVDQGQLAGDGLAAVVLRACSRRVVAASLAVGHVMRVRARKSPARSGWGLVWSSVERHEKALQIRDVEQQRLLGPGGYPLEWRRDRRGIR